MITFRPPDSGKPQATLSLRVRLLLLALIVVGPLMYERARSIENDRIERIAALSEEARALSRQGLEAQQVVVVATRSLVQVVARAHATLGLTQENCDRFLAGATADTPWITGLSIVGANGRVTCSTVANSVGFDLSDRPYFQQALQTRAFVLGDFSVQRARGVRLVAAMPALEPDGRIAGVIAASIDLHWIERIGAEMARRPGALLMVGEDNGTVIAAYPGRDTWLRQRFESNPLLRELQTRDSGLATVEIDGMRRVFGFARLPQTRAFVAVGLDEAEMLRRVDAEMRMTYIQFALIGLLVLLGVWIGGEHAIVRPLRALARMAVHIGHGNLQVRSARRRWAAEFVPLAGALDAMAQRLAEREEALRVANAHLEALARHDSLSGLANRRSFDAKLDEEWRDSARHGMPLALVMIDVDHFKLYNDHYGHLAGDACLRAVGEALAQTGEAAIVARYGGEEFALLFGRTAMECALDVAERLRSRIEALALPHVIAPTGHVTVSVGVAALRAASGNSAQTLIEAADAALYAAKRRGRNVVVGHAEIHLLASA